MNAQAKFDKAGKLLSRGIEWTHILGEGTGYTANPVRGCRHGCRWKMPDGVIVDCYAETQRDRLDGKGAFKSVTFHPEVLADIVRHKTPAGIFIDSMSDLMGNSVEDDWICKVIETMEACPQHRFFVLTKNPGRLTHFVWPDNVLVGLSAPPTFMYGKELSLSQQTAWFFNGMRWLRECRAKTKWVSLEPLCAQIAACLADADTFLDWAVIGAGSDGRRYYQPNENLFANALGALKCPVFYKGNLSRELAARHGGWREEFPR